MLALPKRIDSFRHYVTNGRVGCPRHLEGDVEIDRCYTCTFLVKADFEGPDGWVRCDARAYPSRFGPGSRIDAL